MDDATNEVVVSDLHKAFDGKPVLTGVSLSVRRGEMVAIVGGSGCGKTVLLKHITGHLHADRGHVMVANHSVEPDTQGNAPLLDIGNADEDTL
ncbi:MAG: ATP-binding cassette domain-containing protein, partial [Planctomycetota bacterium]